MPAADESRPEVASDSATDSDEPSWKDKCFAWLGLYAVVITSMVGYTALSVYLIEHVTDFIERPEYQLYAYGSSPY